MPGIPERFYRIAKHKLTEFKDRLDQIDEAAAERELQRENQKATAQAELKESLEAPRAFPSANTSSPSGSGTANTPRLRTPEEIARSGGYAPPSGTNSAIPLSGYNVQNGQPSQIGQINPDTLLLHYQLLGVEPGSDFVTVQGAYNKLAARSDAARFPAGSEEEKTAMEVRTRLEQSYKILREALDPTSRRFDMLEL